MHAALEDLPLGKARVLILFHVGDSLLSRPWRMLSGKVFGMKSGVEEAASCRWTAALVRHGVVDAQATARRVCT